MDTFTPLFSPPTPSRRRATASVSPAPVPGPPSAIPWPSAPSGPGPPPIPSFPSPFSAVPTPQQRWRWTKMDFRWLCPYSRRCLMDVWRRRRPIGTRAVQCETEAVPLTKKFHKDSSKKNSEKLTWLTCSCHLVCRVSCAVRCCSSSNCNFWPSS